MKKIILIIAGNISLALGVIGIFLPLLPTTPFLLLSAGCFLRSSDRLYTRLTRHRVLGEYIRGYLKYRAVSVRAKIAAVSLLWISMVSTVLFFIDAVWLKILLLLVAAGVTFHLLLLKTLTKEMSDELKKENN